MNQTDQDNLDPTSSDSRSQRGSGPESPADQGGESEWRSERPDESASLRKELDESREQVLRVRAEFANYQKRAKQQADVDRAYAVGSLARDLLDPIDNFERAIEALRAAGADNVVSGLDMVRRQTLEVLAKHGVEPIPAQGQPFDPNLHDAILQQPSADHPEGTVVAEYGKGYRIKDRVLRPSKVAVSIRANTSEGV